MNTPVERLQELLGRVAFPETPEDRDDAEASIREMLADAWGAGLRTGVPATAHYYRNPYSEERVKPSWEGQT